MTLYFSDFNINVHGRTSHLRPTEDFGEASTRAMERLERFRDYYTKKDNHRFEAVVKEAVDLVSEMPNEGKAWFIDVLGQRFGVLEVRNKKNLPK